MSFPKTYMQSPLKAVGLKVNAIRFYLPKHSEKQVAFLLLICKRPRKTQAVSGAALTQRCAQHLHPLTSSR